MSLEHRIGARLVCRDSRVAIAGPTPALFWLALLRDIRYYLGEGKYRGAAGLRGRLEESRRRPVEPDPGNAGAGRFRSSFAHPRKAKRRMRDERVQRPQGTYGGGACRGPCVRAWPDQGLEDALRRLDLS